MYLVWQSFRTGDANIYLKTYNQGRWSEPIAVTAHEASDWEPDAAVDAQGRLHIVYDTYRHGDYDVFLRVFADGKLSEEYPIASSPNFEARPTIAIDSDGRAWVAWDDQGPNWALDQPHWTMESSQGDWGVPPAWSQDGSVGQKVSLRRSQKTGVAVFSKGALWKPAGDLEDAMDDDFAMSYEIPQLAMDSSGAPRLFFRRWTNRDDGSNMGERPGAWNIYTTAYVGDRWTKPEMLPSSSGSTDQRVSVAHRPDGTMWVVYPSDNRWKAGEAVLEQAEWRGEIHATYLKPAQFVRPQLEAVTQSPRSRPYKRTAWSGRRNTVAAGEKRYQLYWGDLHRHTEISSDGGYDGTLWDMYRYALDVAELDFIASTDHFYGGSGSDDNLRTYDWWRTQKLVDLFYVPGTFAPLFGYERSLSWPYGHRNVISPDRGATALNRTVPREQENENSPRQPDELSLWKALRGTRTLTIPHTIASGGGTNWAYNDPSMEPLLEIYQGCRLSYEAAGAPRVGPRVQKADGLAQTALGKGYKIGFIASSDHRSTHVSYAAVYAEDSSREGIFEGMRQRHAYAATDNIVVDVRLGDAIMGDSTTTATKPELHVEVRGTAPIDNIQIIKNNAYLYTRRPGQAEVSFTFRDAEAEPGESYYYVRIQQVDGQMAWVSPIWVDYLPE